MRINQNIAAFNAYRNLTTTQNQLSSSLEKLSSGFRINRAADDAAGLVISEGLRAQVKGLQQAARNAQDGISVVQTAEGALTEVHAMLQRMRELAVQSANDSNDAESRAAAQAEVEQLKAEVVRVAEQTSFGQVTLLDGTFGGGPTRLSGYIDAEVTVVGATTGFNLVIEDESTLTLGNVYIGEDTYDTAEGYEAAIQTAIDGAASGTAAEGDISVSVTDLGDGTWRVRISDAEGREFTINDPSSGTLATLGFSDGDSVDASADAAVFQVGANKGDTISFSIGDMTDLDIATVDVSTQGNAEDALDALDTAIGTVSSERGKLGAIQNRLESTIANLQVTAENVQASESRIRDTDMALEMVEFTRAQILQQAGTTMLAQANLVPQSVLALLQ